MFRQQTGYRLRFFLLFFICGLFVGLAGYLTTIPEDIRAAWKLILTIILLVVTVLLYKHERFAQYRQVFMAFLAVSLGIAIAHVIGNWPLRWLSLTTDTPAGISVAKVVESLPIIICILALNKIAGRDVGSIFLKKGKLILSLILGLLTGMMVLIVFLGFGGLQTILNIDSSTIPSWIFYLLLFAFANGFMEELWVRGLWMSRFTEILGAKASLHLTTLIFVVLHVAVYWEQPVALLGLTVVWAFLAYSFGYITQKTESIWGAVLGHAVVDFVYLLGAFAAM